MGHSDPGFNLSYNSPKYLSTALQFGTVLQLLAGTLKVIFKKKKINNNYFRNLDGQPWSFILQCLNIVLGHYNPYTKLFQWKNLICMGKLEKGKLT